MSDDLVSTPAHRTVLSTSSPIFKQLLTVNTGSNVVLYLKGVPDSELQAILQFIYLGQAQILESRIDNFAKAAQELNINELNKQDEESEDTLNTFQSVVTPAQTTDRRTVVNANQTRQLVKTETTALNQDYDRDADGKYKCNQCDYKSPNITNLTLHIENVHLGVKYPCNHCEYEATTRPNLNVHIKAKHMDPQYKCDQCEKKFAHQVALKRHLDKSCIGK